MSVLVDGVQYDLWPGDVLEVTQQYPDEFCLC
ncbi:MAG: hypothetical protein JWN77_2314 [Frankiales bacterium]|jgi:hypothetical protein|nr:hypothetical protein [Frankiales bacterium]